MCFASVITLELFLHKNVAQFLFQTLKMRLVQVVSN